MCPPRSEAPPTGRAGAHPEYLAGRRPPEGPAGRRYPENLAGRRPPEGPAGRRPPGIPGAHPGRAEVPGLGQRAPCGITRGRTARETVGASSTNAGARSGLGGVIARIPDHPSRIPGRQADTLRAQALTRDVRKPRESSQRTPPESPVQGTVRETVGLFAPTRWVRSLGSVEESPRGVGNAGVGRVVGGNQIGAEESPQGYRQARAASATDPDLPTLRARPGRGDDGRAERGCEARWRLRPTRG